MPYTGDQEGLEREMTRELALEAFKSLLDYVERCKKGDCLCVYVDDYAQYTAMLEAKNKRWNRVLKEMERHGLSQTGFDYLGRLILVYAGDDTLCMFVLRAMSGYDQETIGIRCEYSAGTHRCYVWEKTYEEEWKRYKPAGEMEAYLDVLLMLTVDIFDMKSGDEWGRYARLEAYLKSLK